MEENEIVYDYVIFNDEQFTELQTELRQQTQSIQTVNASIVHGTMFLVLLCIFQFYGLLRRALKKGGA